MNKIKKEAKNWLKESEEDLGTTEDCIKVKRFKASAFYSQQASEKALKALQIQKLGKFYKVHDLLII
jgi:HEPN domain-containing protein